MKQNFLTRVKSPLLFALIGGSSLSISPGVAATTITLDFDPFFYQGISYSRGAYLESSVDHLSAVLGISFSEMFMLEGRYGLGVLSGDHYKVKSAWSVLGRFQGQLAFNSDVGVYGLLGYAKSNLKYKVATDSRPVERNFSESGLGFGFGASYTLSNSVQIAVDYFRVEDHNSVNVNLYFSLF